MINLRTNISPFLIIALNRRYLSSQRFTKCPNSLNITPSLLPDLYKSLSICLCVPVQVNTLPVLSLKLYVHVCSSGASRDRKSGAAWGGRCGLGRITLFYLDYAVCGRC